MPHDIYALFAQHIAPERLRAQAPLREYTTMRVGGPADLLVAPASEEELLRALSLAREADLPVCVIGNGSNLLVSDNGFRGVVVHIGKDFAGIRLEGTALHAQAGALLSSLARTAAENALSGLAFAAGIPGSVGGAVCMNAGAYGGEISQVLTQARVYDHGEVKTLSREQLDLGYRHSAVMENGWLVLSVEFSLQAGERAQIEDEMADLNRRRREKQPLQYPSCGSFFKRPQGYFAGALIEQAGLKGFSIGGAQVSALHAGFIINRDGATADDIYRLMRHVQNTVYAQSGVMLEPEVKLIGKFES